MTLPVPSVGGVIERHVDELDQRAQHAASNMREGKNAPDRDNDVPRWGEAYWSGYLHGLCASIAQLTGEDSLQVSLRYEALVP